MIKTLKTHATLLAAKAHYVFAGEFHAIITGTAVLAVAEILYRMI